jgi:hypothetical protein
MADPDFLRKRTENLLRITETSYKTRLLLGGDIGVGSLKVDKRTFDWLIDAWSHSGEDDAANNALSLLYRMEELRDNSVDDSSDDIDVDVEGRRQQHVVSPDVKSYTKVINAIAHSGMHDAGERAEQVLERMISASSRLRDDDLRPNTLAYTYVIDAYARSTSSRAPHAAQRIVEEMERLRAGGDALVRPTSRAWNSVISAWAQWEGEEMVSEKYYRSPVSGSIPTSFCPGRVEYINFCFGFWECVVRCYIYREKYSHASSISALSVARPERK